MCHNTMHQLLIHFSIFTLALTKSLGRDRSSRPEKDDAIGVRGWWPVVCDGLHVRAYEFTSAPVQPCREIFIIIHRSPGNAPESDPHPKSVGFKTGSTGKRKNTHRMSNKQGRRARWPPPRAEGARHRTSSYKKCILIKAVCQGVAQKEV